jgi:hypothetical protein
MMDNLDKERVDRDPDKTTGNDLFLTFAMIPIFAVLGAILAVLAGLMLPKYAPILFGVAILMGVAAAGAYAARVMNRTRGM